MLLSPGVLSQIPVFILRATKKLQGEERYHGIMGSAFKNYGSDCFVEN